MEQLGPTGRILMKFDVFPKISREVLSCITIRYEYRVIYMKMFSYL